MFLCAVIKIRQCDGSGGQLMGFLCGDLCSIAGKSKWDVW